MNRWFKLISLLIVAIVTYVEAGSLKLTWTWDETGYALSYYEVVLTRDTGETYTYTTTTKSIEIPRVRSGDYTVKVRAVLSGTQSSPYCVSTDAACAVSKVAGLPEAWKMQWNPTPPGATGTRDTR